MQPAIRVENLAKSYRISHTAERGGYKTLRESMSGLLTTAFKRGAKNADLTEEFWALNEINFDVQPGEVVGIIGRNGAGKSTLLKILSRITKPTKGQITLNGRIGSLLEVGTGFHPELTGRENIYLNGSILGMRRAEIQKQFDAIVDFSGVERFIDTPVKRYSSGMYVRLAFAVAAHLEPEILLVDEVLAVGDQAFQKKCIGRMGEIAAGGRTVCLVSHDLPMLSRLATRAIWIDAGRVHQQGDPAEIIRDYCSAANSISANVTAVDLGNHPGRRRGVKSLIKRAAIYNAANEPAANVALGESITIEIEIADFVAVSDTAAIIYICDTFGTAMAQANSWIQSDIDMSGCKRAVARCTISDIRLVPGEYRIDAALGNTSDFLDRIDDVLRLTVDPGNIYGTGRVPTRRNGLFVLNATWQLTGFRN